MPTKLHAGNTLATLIRQDSSSAESTTAGSFDSTYAPNSVSVPNGGFGPDFTTKYISPPIFASSVTEYWFVGEFYCSGTGTNTNAFWAAYNSSGQKVCDIRMNGSQQMAFAFYNGSGDTVSSYVTRPLWSTRKRFAIHVVCGASGSYNVIVDGVSAMSGSITSASCDNIKQVRCYNGCYNATGYWSQIMGADYDISGARYMLPAINGNSAVDTGKDSGTYTDVNETPTDEATVVSIGTSTNKAGFTKAAITVPAGFAIKAAVVGARCKIAGTITDGKIGVLNSGSRDTSGNKGYTSSQGPALHIVANDPATSALFTQSGFNSAEVFAEAV